MRLLSLDITPNNNRLLYINLAVWYCNSPFQQLYDVTLTHYLIKRTQALHTLMVTLDNTLAAMITYLYIN